jgi:hypothetical protein
MKKKKRLVPGTKIPYENWIQGWLVTNQEKRKMNKEHKLPKVGLDAFNDLAKSHDAHVKEVERLQEELGELKKLKLVDEYGELLLECKLGDEHHRLILEVGLNTILEKFMKDKE